MKVYQPNSFIVNPYQKSSLLTHLIFIVQKVKWSHAEFVFPQVTLEQRHSVWLTFYLPFAISSSHLFPLTQSRLLISSQALSDRSLNGHVTQALEAKT